MLKVAVLGTFLLLSVLASVSYADSASEIDRLFLKNLQQDTIDLLTKDAESGDAHSQYELAKKYDNGEGVAKDKCLAKHWYSKAANQRYKEAQNALGVMYEYGECVDKNDQKAIYWYTKAAEQNYEKAEINLLEIKAKNGDAKSKYIIGRKYDNGDWYILDKSEAVKYYKEAAYLGYSDAQNALGVMYEYGEGVQKDLELARVWYKKAAYQGHYKALKNLKELNERLKKIENKNNTSLISFIIIVSIAVTVIFIIYLLKSLFKKIDNKIQKNIQNERKKRCTARL